MESVFYDSINHVTVLSSSRQIVALYGGASVVLVVSVTIDPSMTQQLCHFYDTH